MNSSFLCGTFFLLVRMSQHLTKVVQMMYCASKRSASSQASEVVFLLKFFFMHLFHSGHMIVLRTVGTTHLHQRRGYSFAWSCALRTKIEEEEEQYGMETPGLMPLCDFQSIFLRP